MKKLLKPANIVFYFLMLLVCFSIGLFFAGAIGAGKNQGLAGGAIVVGYGVLFGGIGFIAAFFIASAVNIKSIIKTNWLLLIILLCTFGYTYYKFNQREKLKKEENEKFKPAPGDPATIEISMVAFHASEKALPQQQSAESSMGIGFFKPNYFEYPTLYFYGGVNPEKGLLEHIPLDSVVFAKDEHNNPTTTYAPPWLYPEHLKPDYGIIVFKVLGIGHDFIKVEANNQTKQITYLDKNKGVFTAWAAFLLTVNSVEFNENSSKKMFVKPLDHASEVNVNFDFMQPLLVEQDWMYVKLVDYGLKEQGKAWIRWKNDNVLLIAYSFLS